MLGRRKRASRLGLMLLASGCLWKAGANRLKRPVPTLDDIYGGADEAGATATATQSRADASTLEQADGAASNDGEVRRE